MGTTLEEIARLRRAKAEIKEEIEEKGVEVPDSALLDTYDDYVRQIVGSSEPAVWGEITGDLDDQTDLKDALDAKYEKPSGGIPDTDLAEAVQTSLGLADTAYQKPSGGIPAADIASDVIPSSVVKYVSQSLSTSQKSQARTNIGAGTYSKPSGGIPASDIASGVIPTVPTISTDISADASSDAKTASPKAVKTFVEGKGYGTYSKPSGGIPASDIASGVIPTVPTISTSISDDATSDAKTASPKAVKTYVDGVIPSVPTISTSISDDATSDTKVASPKAVKTYVDGAIPTVPTISTDIATDYNDNTKTAGAKAVYDHVAALLGPDVYIGTGTGWGTSPGECYLRTNYFSGNRVPKKAGDAVFSTTTRNLHICGALTWDSGQNCYKTTPTFVMSFPSPPTISTDIATDSTSDAKTASPKAVADFAVQALTTGGKKIWVGTQADYDLLTPDANTLYFIKSS